MMDKARLGEVELLVHGACSCGWRCALPEGAIWPACPVCGDPVCPDGVMPEPGDEDERRAYRRLHGVGYLVALCVPEAQGAELIGSALRRAQKERARPPDADAVLARLSEPGAPRSATLLTKRGRFVVMREAEYAQLALKANRLEALGDEMAAAIEGGWDTVVAGVDRCECGVCAAGRAWREARRA